MTTQTAPYNTAGATLGSLINLVETNLTMPVGRRREMVSAIRTVSRVLGGEPHMISASATELRTRLAEALPAAAGVSASRFRNAKSLARTAMALLDPAAIPARSRSGLLPSWDDLLSEPDAKPLQRGLARFSKYCSRLGLEPAMVDQAIFDRFYDDLVHHCLIRSPRETQQTACNAWNRAVEAVPDWPQVMLKIADFRRNPSLSWSAFPPSLSADVEGYFAPRSEDVFNLFNDLPTLRASTIIGKRNALRQFATCLVEAGRDPVSIATLADLTTVEAATQGLTALHKRAGGVKTTRLYSMAYVLLGVARHHVQADAKTIAGLKDICKSLKPKTTGMTAKNRFRLRQFDNPALLGALLALPEKLFKDACREANPTVEDARLAEMAIAIEVLLMAPIRVSNLAELEIGRTFVLDGSAVGQIIIDHTEVKNTIDLEIPLQLVTIRMTQNYLKRFHPLLASSGCKMVFPSRDGGHRNPVSLSHKISTIVMCHSGIKINSHLFRHLAAKVFLEAFPGRYGIVRMLLGHRSIETTTRTYCGTEFVHAFREYDAYINKLRDISAAQACATRARRHH